ncbi:hypothetical protein [Haloarcula pellucida]|uniref:Uncharacterized protein n=1 Tax=Haloarcula pellucida TaxID=1427151 RepID=A0A830GHF6_9EURY|nr:hypothetical protein [Halomicroarcula pellucida]MBX0346595.1 hypothetical protein [Halomicroarcula pellucida]GGN84465.1 hypothetical protein GCM10009030_00140 [Halomicroarcula pellucida]
MKSFADPSTTFELVFEEVRVGDGGLTAPRPTGEIRCTECGATALNIDDFPHEQDCPQRFVHSRWYAEQLQD